MLLYVVRRLLYAIPIGIGVTFIVFSLVHIAPGDPISALLPNEATQEMVDQARQEYGLDKPFLVQYAIWLGHAAMGDLGKSIGSGCRCLACHRSYAECRGLPQILTLVRIKRTILARRADAISGRVTAVSHIWQRQRDQSRAPMRC